jgi:hypothetical protein
VPTLSRSVALAAQDKAVQGDNCVVRWSGTNSVEYPKCSTCCATARHSLPDRAALGTTPKRNGLVTRLRVSPVGSAEEIWALASAQRSGAALRAPGSHFKAEVRLAH